jgi:hypothetical protein
MYIKSCSLKFYVGLVCGSFRFFPQSSVVLSFSLSTFFHFLRLSILLTISYTYHGFLAVFSIYPTKSLIVSKTLYYIFSLHLHVPTFTCDCTEFFFYSILHDLSFSIYSSKPHLGFSCWNPTIFFSPLQNFTTNQRWAESIYSTESVCIFFILPESMLHKYIVQRNYCV